MAADGDVATMAAHTTADAGRSLSARGGDGAASDGDVAATGSIFMASADACSKVAAGGGDGSAGDGDIAANMLFATADAR